MILIEFRPKISMSRSHPKAAGPGFDISGWLEEQLAQASPDLLRSMAQSFAEALMAAEADARSICVSVRALCESAGHAKTLWGQRYDANSWLQRLSEHARTQLRTRLLEE